jgi:hypothetical protein
MKGLIKADALTLVFAALLAGAAVWLFADQVAGAKNLLIDRVFTFALGLFLGNELRLLRANVRRES